MKYRMKMEKQAKEQVGSIASEGGYQIGINCKAVNSKGSDSDLWHGGSLIRYIKFYAANKIGVLL